MKLIKTSKSNNLRISKSEWTSIGVKCGWMKQARMSNFWINAVINNPEIKDSLRFEFDKYLEIAKQIKQHEVENFNPNIKSERPYEEKKRERDQLMQQLQQQWDNGVLKVIQKHGLDDNYGSGKTNPTPEDLQSLFAYDRITPI